MKNQTVKILVSLVITATLLVGCNPPAYYFEGALNHSIQNTDLLPNGRLALVVDSFLQQKGFKYAHGWYTYADDPLNINKLGRRTWYDGPNGVMMCIYIDQRKLYLVQDDSTSRTHLAELARELEEIIHKFDPDIVVEWIEGTFDRPMKGLGA